MRKFITSGMAPSRLLCCSSATRSAPPGACGIRKYADFSKHFRVLRYDTRGFGESTITPGSYTIAQLSWDVVHLLDSLGLDRVHFCGLSMGGMTGMFLGANAPERFNKIVLCNTSAKFGTPETWNARINAVQEGGMKAVASSVIDRWLTPAYRVSHPAETNAALGCCSLLIQKDISRIVPRFATPTCANGLPKCGFPHLCLQARMIPARLLRMAIFGRMHSWRPLCGSRCRPPIQY